MRKVHFTRAVDMAFGSWLNGTKTNLRNLAYRKLLDVKDGQMGLNAFIRDNTPAFYVVNVPLIARTGINALLTDIRFINSVDLGLGDGSSFHGNEDFPESIKKALSNVKELEDGLIKAISARLPDSLSKVTASSFYSAVQEAHEFFVLEAERLNKQKSGYLGYKIAATKAGQNLRISLNKIGTSVVQDPATLVTNMPPGSFLVVAPTFTIAVANTNKIIDAVFTEYLGTKGITLNKIAGKDTKKATEGTRAFNIGNIVHAGHTAASVNKAQVGINTPGILVNGLISKRFSELEKAVGSLPEHIEYSVDFNPNYNASGILLDMQFNIAVSMPADLNSGILSVKEQAAIRNNIKDAVLLELKEAVRQSFTSDVISAIDYPAASASPNMLEVIKSSIVSNILGQKALTVKTKNRSKSKKLKIQQPSVSKSIAIKPSKMRATTSALPAIKQAAIKVPVSDFTDLQLILERSIRDEVQRNMGKGSDTKVLNYRTGRFADSVKIERLSQSRAGMITVFYSYMKNPYATFSDGGRQQYPKSRDPKLLISKSIREIASREAYNNLRAVNV